MNFNEIFKENVILYDNIKSHKKPGGAPTLIKYLTRYIFVKMNPPSSSLFNVKNISRDVFCSQLRLCTRVCL